MQTRRRLESSTRSGPQTSRMSCARGDDRAGMAGAAIQHAILHGSRVQLTRGAACLALREVELYGPKLQKRRVRPGLRR